MFDETNYNPSVAKIVDTDEIRKAIASLIMSDDFHLKENTNKFIEWYNNNQFLFKHYEDNNINRE